MQLSSRLKSFLNFWAIKFKLVVSVLRGRILACLVRWFAVNCLPKSDLAYLVASSASSSAAASGGKRKLFSLKLFPLLVAQGCFFFFLNWNFHDRPGGVLQQRERRRRRTRTNLARGCQLIFQFSTLTAATRLVKKARQKAF